MSHYELSKEDQRKTVFLFTIGWDVQAIVGELQAHSRPYGNEVKKEDVLNFIARDEVRQESVALGILLKEYPEQVALFWNDQGVIQVEGEYFRMRTSVIPPRYVDRMVWDSVKSRDLEKIKKEAFDLRAVVDELRQTLERSRSEALKASEDKDRADAEVVSMRQKLEAATEKLNESTELLSLAHGMLGDELVDGLPVESIDLLNSNVRLTLKEGAVVTPSMLRRLTEQGTEGEVNLYVQGGEVSDG